MSEERPDRPASPQPGPPPHPGHPGQQFAGQPYGGPAPGVPHPGMYPPQPGMPGGPPPGWGPGTPFPGVPQPPKKSYTGLIVVALVAVVALAAAGVALLVTIGRSPTPTTASSASGFDEVCQGGSISNAAEFGAPYRPVAFVHRSSDVGHAGIGSFSGRDTWRKLHLGSASDLPPSQLNTVACLTELKQARSKTQTCTFTQSGSEVQVDYFSTRYQVAVYEAKTGRKAKDLGEVSGSADSCPFLASFDRNDRRIVASPDAQPLQTLLAGFTG
ncbi:hypothetical protein GOARA_008_00150 [Gordonia araii NBRC 100433]|uniref:Uncharacterized protein n=1 Tax=Gordonia araii NBRC 100433 TaxID=1073574 RepID=G7GXJ0_9ACTN|nr:hypothetical protein [Gordonia araii]NNG98246.1 hypothetical protein [Gordonia araii NBRC 100433]GAB08315.1 hypothetical protein GOARA_008_00150 [Gordonia araii NBRC 100433]